mmetsp:Transcript_26995/g.90362  ORF Transcript_26995/g.90362 Transcript_26995/m.90362 type:complete len:214 (-) Transcript_26995:89-730(-)
MSAGSESPTMTVSSGAVPMAAHASMKMDGWGLASARSPPTSTRSGWKKRSAPHATSLGRWTSGDPLVMRARAKPARRKDSSMASVAGEKRQRARRAAIHRRYASAARSLTGAEVGPVAASSARAAVMALVQRDTRQSSRVRTTPSGGKGSRSRAARKQERRRSASQPARAATERAASATARASISRVGMRVSSRSKMTPAHGMGATAHWPMAR